MMSLDLKKRPKWQIEELLDRLAGAEVRIAAEAFSPSGWDMKVPIGLIPVAELVLPNNRAAADLPVYFEGRLEQFTRRIGVVYVWLGPPGLSGESVEGMVYFRGRTVAILRGPAIVQLACPFQVEKLPSDPGNYWRDLHFPRVQFELPSLSEDTGKPDP
jgi:hypothetical protein